MPTICFSDDFDAKLKKMLTITFKRNCHDLGLTDFDATVQLRKRKLPGKCMGTMMRVAKDCFLVTVGSKGTIADTIFALGHELVHVRQHRNGRLKSTREGVVWEGRLLPAIYCNMEENYLKLPWEIEAHKIHDDVCHNAVMALKDAGYTREEVLGDETR